MPPRKQSLGSDRPDQRAAGAETLRAVDLADLIEAERADVLSVSLDVDPSRPGAAHHPTCRTEPAARPGPGHLRRARIVARVRPPRPPDEPRTVWPARCRPRALGRRWGRTLRPP